MRARRPSGATAREAPAPLRAATGREESETVCEAGLVLASACLAVRLDARAASTTPRPRSANCAHAAAAFGLSERLRRCTSSVVNVASGARGRLTSDSPTAGQCESTGSTPTPSPSSTLWQHRRDVPEFPAPDAASVRFALNARSSVCQARHHARAAPSPRSAAPGDLVRGLCGVRPSRRPGWGGGTGAGDAGEHVDTGAA